MSLPQNGSQRVAFAFVAAGDSATYLDACRRSQEWYDANVGVAEPSLKPQASGLKLEAFPNPSNGLVRLSFSLLPAPSSLRVYDTQGRLLITRTLDQDFPRFYVNLEKLSCRSLGGGIERHSGPLPRRLRMYDIPSAIA